MPTRILIADDDKLTRELLKDILIADGMEIAGDATNGHEAVRAQQILKPDVTIMDIVMPGMDGVKATRAILQSDPSARIVICSELGQESLVGDAIDAGARDFVRKPFKAEAVTETIRRVLTARS